jgi:hypothetical protein
VNETNKRSISRRGTAVVQTCVSNSNTNTTAVSPNDSTRRTNVNVGPIPVNKQNYKGCHGLENTHRIAKQAIKDLDLHNED